MPKEKQNTQEMKKHDYLRRKFYELPQPKPRTGRFHDLKKPRPFQIIRGTSLDRQNTVGSFLSNSEIEKPRKFKFLKKRHLERQNSMPLDAKRSGSNLNAHDDLNKGGTVDRQKTQSPRMTKQGSRSPRNEEQDKTRKNIRQRTFQRKNSLPIRLPRNKRNGKRRPKPRMSNQRFS